MAFPKYWLSLEAFCFMRQRSRRTPRDLPTFSPRLFDRTESAHYLGLSIPTFDALRARGEIPPPVPVPAVLAGNGHLRVPLWDRMVLDDTIERWKANSGAGAPASHRVIDERR
jgi:hypothetical protein